MSNSQNTQFWRQCFWNSRHFLLASLRLAFDGPSSFTCEWFLVRVTTILQISEAPGRRFEDSFRGSDFHHRAGGSNFLPRTEWRDRRNRRNRSRTWSVGRCEGRCQEPCWSPKRFPLDGRIDGRMWPEQGFLYKGWAWDCRPPTQ